jgi:NAD-dependent SIR2 family protein deacetylase
MEGIDNDFSPQRFLAYYVQNAPQLMWFLGAGTSRTAGMPTATDIIWDLKRKYYCLQENQDLQAHDINNQAIRRKIQNYVDSKGFPALWSSEEYSFYCDLTFGNDHSLQQQYIRDQLDPLKISLNIGHRVLAAFLEMGRAKVIFTTNFDGVIETAFSAVAGKQLGTFHLEGSYAALDALNAERFPIYAKIHGDFRYQKIKNLAADLLHNDNEIQKCFLAASSRYGSS